MEPYLHNMNEQLLLSFAEEAIQQNRLGIGFLLFNAWLLAKTILQRYLINHNWMEETQSIHLALIIRTLIQMTIDITNIATLVENDNSTTVFDTIQSFFHVLHVINIFSHYTIETGRQYNPSYLFWIKRRCRMVPSSLLEFGIIQL